MQISEFNKALLALLSKYFQGFNMETYEILDKEQSELLKLKVDADEILLGCKEYHTPFEEELCMYHDKGNDKFYIRQYRECNSNELEKLGYHSCERYKEMPSWLVQFFTETRTASEQAGDMLRAIYPQLEG